MIKTKRASENSERGTSKVQRQPAIEKVPS